MEKGHLSFIKDLIGLNIELQEMLHECFERIYKDKAKQAEHALEHDISSMHLNGFLQGLHGIDRWLGLDKKEKGDGE